MGRGLVDILSQPQIRNSSKQLFTAPFNINLQQVDFAYPERSNTLSQINIQLSSQGLYAIIGESGAGKSTLVDMILGFVQPSSGQVQINNNALTAKNRDNWLQHCGWISQQVEIFHGSLGFNIALSETYDQHQVDEALQNAGLNDFINTLEQGVDSVIGESGAGLSGGQAQRLALARVFYHKPDVLILDEPTSHLDQETEKIITASIKAYAAEHLVIVIAHRLHTVIDAKEIIVLEQGKIIESGSHQALLSHNGYYAQQVSI